METKKYRTRQEERRLTYPKGKKYIVALDIGYSGTKIFTENGYICFPSYAKKLEHGMMSIADDKDILYRDESGVYMVGYNAQNMTDDMSTNDTDGELFSRKRYADKRFKIISNVALALATRNKNDNREIIVETGLPSSYMNDSDALKKAICKPAEFDIKKGSGEWEHYKFDIKENQIDVIPQPSGALYSVMTKNDGQFVDNVKEIIAGNTLVMDIGFGTFDFYGIKNRMIECRDSSDEIGMRKVLENTSKKILDDTGEEIRVATMQKKLEDGCFEAVNEEDLTSDTKSIAPYLEKSTDEVFEEAMNKAKSVTNSFRGYNNLIISGGTGEAWYDKIKGRLKGMKTLKIIPANINDQYPLIYSVVRGYYLYCYRVMGMKK